MTLRYRILAAFLSATLLLGVLPIGVLAQDAPIELVFRQLDAENQTPGLVQAVADWNAAHPDIQVRLETGSASEGLAQYTREVQAGGGPDILHSAFVWTRDLARAGQALNLTPYIESTPPGAGIDDFIALDLATFEGSVYGIPWTVDTFTPVYNPRLLEEAGITEFPDTWDELFAAAQQLTKDTDGDGRIDQFGFAFPAGGEANGGVWFLANYYLWSSGKYWVQRSEANPDQWEVGVTAEDVAGVLSYFYQFIETGATPESLLAVSSFSDPEIVSGVANSEYAITIVPPQTFRAIQTNTTETLATTVVPQGSETRISHLGGRTLVINPNSPHPDEAWQFINYLLSPELFALHQGYYPAQNALFDQLAFPEAEQGYVEQIPLAITFAVYVDSTAPVSGLQRAVAREFSAYFSGQKTVEQASADLITALESLLANGSE
jgi:multiple sugar transport system substrate-binding protein